MIGKNVFSITVQNRLTITEAFRPLYHHSNTIHCDLRTHTKNENE